MRLSGGRVEWARVTADPGTGLLRVMPPVGYRVQFATVDSYPVNTVARGGVTEMQVPPGKSVFLVFNR
jgi:hypothetical protein